MDIWFVITTALFLIARNVSGHNELPYPEENSVTSVMKVDADQHRTSRVKRGVCGGDMYATNGVITSPWFPQKYRDNTFCRWNISVAETEQIEVSFMSLGLQSCTNCSCDHVRTFSRYTDDLMWHNGLFCGTSLPSAYTAYENHLVLEFKTDNAVQGPGFSAGYTKKPCGGVFTDMKGTVRSPRHPNYYPRNKRCTYEIVAAPRHCIILSFTRFDLKYKSDCSDDSLHVYSTAFSGTVNNYGRSCGCKAPSNITCEGTKVRMELKSGRYGEHTGFLLDYQQVYTECADNNGGCKHICKPNIPGNHTCTCRTGYLLHPDGRDCKPENLEGKIVQLTSVTQENTLLLFSWKWHDDVVPSKLSGYYFKAVSSGHTFQTTLPSTLCNYTAHELHFYTEYEVTLGPYYGKKGQSCEIRGKPITLSVRTPASAPSAPTAVKPWPQTTEQRTGEVSLAIFAPKAWNSKPDSFRVHWKPSDADEATVRIVNLTDSMASALRSKNYVNVTLLVKPGRTYDASVSACGVGDLKETLVGPETASTFVTTPLAPVLLSPKIIDANCAIVSWLSPSPSERYETRRMDMPRHEMGSLHHNSLLVQEIDRLREENKMLRKSLVEQEDKYKKSIDDVNALTMLRKSLVEQEDKYKKSIDDVKALTTQLEENTNKTLSNYTECNRRIKALEDNLSRETEKFESRLNDVKSTLLRMGWNLVWTR